MRGIIEIEKWVTGNGDAFAIQFSGAQRTTKGRGRCENSSTGPIYQRQKQHKKGLVGRGVRAVDSNPERILSSRCDRRQYASDLSFFPHRRRGTSMPNSFPTAPDLDFPLAVRDINSIHQSHQRLGRFDFYYGIRAIYVNAYIYLVLGGCRRGAHGTQWKIDVFGARSER